MGDAAKHDGTEGCESVLVVYADVFVVELSWRMSYTVTVRSVEDAITAFGYDGTRTDTNGLLEED